MDYNGRKLVPYIPPAEYDLVFHYKGYKKPHIAQEAGQ